MALDYVDPKSEDIIDLLLSDPRFVAHRFVLAQVGSTTLSLGCIGRFLSVGRENLAEAGGLMLENAIRQNR
jgi:hypothetical protein